MILLALLALTAPPVIGCPVERAHYVLRHHPKWTAYFREVASNPDWPSGLALIIDDQNSSRTSWWLPWNGGTDGLLNVGSTTDVTKNGYQPPTPDSGPRPEGSRQYLGFDANYDLIYHVPKRGDKAPSHMLFPDSAGAGDRTFGWKDFFDLKSCSPEARLAPK